MSANGSGAILAGDSRSGSDSEGEGGEQSVGVVLSVDPGRQHCGVVRYDAARDRFTHAALLNVLCTCAPEARGRAPPTIVDLVRASGRGGEEVEVKVEGGGEKWPPLAAIHVPTPTDFPLQLACAAEERPELYAGADLVAIERQNTQDTGNMVIQAALQTRYLERGVIVAPAEVKGFWNAAARAAGLPDPVFRLTGSHSVNKTDAKRLAPRVLGTRERALFDAAAAENARHKARCPVMYKLGRKRKGGKGGGAAKSDDLMDAAIQAIYAAQARAGVAPGAPESAARRRFERYRNNAPPPPPAKRARPRKRRKK